MTGALDRLVARSSAALRWRRAAAGARTWALAGAAGAGLALVFKGALGATTPALALGLLAAGAAAGAAAGWLRRVTPVEAARLADRSLGLEDRLATAIECRGPRGRRAGGPRGRRADGPGDGRAPGERDTPLVGLLAADAEAAASRAGEPSWRLLVPPLGAPKGHWLGLAIAGLVALVLLPPLPRISGPAARQAATDSSRQAGSDEAELSAQRAIALASQTGGRSGPEARPDRVSPGSVASGGAAGVEFRDTRTAGAAPSFASFLKRGDERLQVLGDAARLPDLASDHPAREREMLSRRSGQLAGADGKGVDPRKLRELLEDMSRLGRRDGDGSGGEAGEGLQALEQGDAARALQAMQRGLERMRAADERAQAGKGLQGGAESGTGEAPRDQARAAGQVGGGVGEQDFSDGEGRAPGTGTSASPRGEAAGRIQARAHDTSLSGESGRGPREAHDTSLATVGGRAEIETRYLGLVGQYRRAMEEALAREQVPREFQQQIRDYFRALEAR